MSLAHIADIRDEETGQIIGFQVGRAAALSDWKFRRESTKGRAFRLLVKRLGRQRWYRNLSSERRAAVDAQCRAWQLAHPERTRAYRQKSRSKPGIRRRDYLRHKARRQAKSAALKAATVYTCVWCGKSWPHDPTKRLPRNKPKYCSTSCRGRAAYARDPEAWKERSRRRYHADPERHKAQHRAWWRDNPEARERHLERCRRPEERAKDRDRKAARAAAKRAAAPPRICVVCGAQFRREQTGTTKICSDECRRERAKQRQRGKTA